MTQQRAAIYQRSSRIEKAVRAMIDVLDNEEEQMRYMELLDDLVRPAGLTNAIRSLLQGAGRAGLTPMEVRDAARVALFGYSNPLASVHTVLKRLARTEDVAVVDKDGKTAYRWISHEERMGYNLISGLTHSRGELNLSRKTFGQRLAEVGEKASENSPKKKGGYGKPPVTEET